MIQRRKANQGFVLIIVLGVISILSVLMLSLREVVNTESRISQTAQNRTRARLLAQSGVQRAIATLEQSNTVSFNSAVQSLGPGTYKNQGDEMHISIKDASGKININDGVRAGQLELGGTYQSNAIDPWPGNDVTDMSPVAVSARINLRLRRLLNAYGDTLLVAALFYSKSGGSSEMPTVGSFGIIPGIYRRSADYAGTQPQTYGLTSTAALDVGQSMPGGAGLGDHILQMRPDSGFSSVEEIRDTVNAWASGEALHASFYKDKGFDTFFDMAVNDLTVLNDEDDNFKRLKKQHELYGRTWNQQTGSFDGYFMNDVTDARFNPNYIDEFPYDLSNNLWAPHSVALINLNAASRYVRTAVFFAPANVAYLCEGAATHTHFQEDRVYGFAYQVSSHNSSGNPINTGWDHLIDKGMGRASIGVRGPIFRPRRVRENGRRAGSVTQVNRLMSLRDAFALADHSLRYDPDGDTVPNNIENFGDFRKFLTWHREQIRYGSEPAPLDVMDSVLGVPAYAQNFKVVYERAEPITHHTTPGLYQADHVRALFTRFDSIQPHHHVDALDPNKEVDPVWVSQYWYSTQVDDGLPTNSWHGGWFLEDYVERTLPHVMSCTRRLPGFLGAPQALTSPYMIVEPYAYTTDLVSSRHKDTSNNWVWGRDHFDMAAYNNQATGLQASTPVDDPANNPDNWHVARQAKLCVEDLVERAQHPKLIFHSPGIFEIVSTGLVKSPDQGVAAKARITASIKVYERQVYRSQQDFVSVTDSVNSSQDIVMGPEFDPAHSSSDWLTCGLRDAGEQVAKPSSNLNTLNLYDLYLNFNPGPTAQVSQTAPLLVNNPTVTQPSLMLADNPSYATESGGMFNAAATGWDLADIEVQGAWAAADGNDTDPFGQGIFLNQNGHGEWASNANGDPFSDSLYWILNDKLKSWDETDPSQATFYGQYPTGLGFHRGFAAAWFRVPTSYPYAHPVVYRGPKLGLAGDTNVVRNKTQLCKTILSLNLHEKVEIYDWGVYTPITRPVLINVGYYSGFDGYLDRFGATHHVNNQKNQSQYEFEHGIYGYLGSGHEHYPGSVARPPVSGPLSLATFTHNTQYVDYTPSPVPTGLPWHGERWTYGMMMFHKMPVASNNNPGEFEFGKLTEGVMGPGHFYTNEEILYSGYRGTGGPYIGYQYESDRITHKLPMNNTPECGPGTWHRVYAFWFLRHNLTEGDDINGYWGAWDGTLSGDHQAWGAGSESRYYAIDSVDMATGNGLGAVDVMDQFGIWFRDDSNYNKQCSSPVSWQQPQAANGNTVIKPQPSWIYENVTSGSGRPGVGDTHCYPNLWLTHDAEMCLSIGDMPVRRVQRYEPKTGERTNTLVGNTGSSSTAETHRYPAYRFNSTIDDVIFAYGPNISVPGGSQNSYFRGLFHNARWLETEPDDEVRYQPSGQELILKVGQDIPLQSELLMVNAKIYQPDDTQLNYAHVACEVWADDSNTLISQASTTVSRDAKSIMLNANTSALTNVRFVYLDQNPLGNALVTQSTIRNRVPENLNTDYSDQGGDSFTNIPYIQELVVEYRPSTGVEVLRWSES